MVDKELQHDKKNLKNKKKQAVVKYRYRSYLHHKQS